jgi:threonine aldolase
MDKISTLLNDYSSPAHPTILNALQAAAGNDYPGYGLDRETEQAKRMIVELIGRSDADVHFLAGGTQTNLTAIAAFLKPHEAVIAAESSHINMHETGAIEACGHKILLGKASDGKLNAESVQAVVDFHTDEHMVKPGLVFISQSTELGTVYTKAELAEINAVCAKNGLLLYVDGARLGSALTAPGNDVGPDDLARLADAFYIGGTKNGLLFGEALVILNPRLKSDFRYSVKQRGGLLAKGFLLGIQFNALFRDGLFFALASQANQAAGMLRDALSSIGYEFLPDTTTNQLFPIMDVDTVRRLAETYLFEEWRRLDERRMVIRLVASWATRSKDIEAFLDVLAAVRQ